MSENFFSLSKSWQIQTVKTLYNVNSLYNIFQVPTTQKLNLLEFEDHCAHDALARDNPACCIPFDSTDCQAG